MIVVIQATGVFGNLVLSTYHAGSMVTGTGKRIWVYYYYYNVSWHPGEPVPER